MPATPLPTSERFFAPEISRIYFVLTIANIASPTRAEINAGTDLTNEIADLSGWSVTTGMIATPGMTRFTPQIPGRTSAEDSSITFYGDQGGDDVRTVLARGDRGYVIFCDGGDITGHLADVFPVQVRNVGKLRSLGDEGFRLTVGFAITRVPAEDVLLPATV
jgi:hypothetical protein